MEFEDVKTKCVSSVDQTLDTALTPPKYNFKTEVHNKYQVTIKFLPKPFDNYLCSLKLLPFIQKKI